ncbi:MAG TPA: hypothetical protein VK356_07800, partial [Thermomicrobiales bacterium]|nr:hypothetical protein [Thermomicrobiales bacterium]
RFFVHPFTIRFGNAGYSPVLWIFNRRPVTGVDIFDNLPIGPGVRSVVAEGAEQEAIGSARYDARGNGGSAGVGLDGERRREKLHATAAIVALDSVSPPGVPLIVTALAPGVLRGTSRECASARSTAWFSTLSESPFPVGRSWSLDTCPTRLG